LLQRGSYIGESFENYVKEHYPNIGIDTIEIIDGTWRGKIFHPCAVFHVAGLARADIGKGRRDEKTNTIR